MEIFGYIDIVKTTKGGPLVLPLHSVFWHLPRKMSAYGPVEGKKSEIQCLPRRRKNAKFRGYREGKKKNGMYTFYI